MIFAEGLRPHLKTGRMGGEPQEAGCRDIMNQQEVDSYPGLSVSSTSQTKFSPFLSFTHLLPKVINSEPLFCILQTWQPLPVSEKESLTFSSRAGCHEGTSESRRLVLWGALSLRG